MPAWLQPGFVHHQLTCSLPRPNLAPSQSCIGNRGWKSIMMPSVACDELGSRQAAPISTSCGALLARYVIILSQPSCRYYPEILLPLSRISAVLETINPETMRAMVFRARELYPSKSRGVNVTPLHFTATFAIRLRYYSSLINKAYSKYLPDCRARYNVTGTAGDN